MSDKLGLRYWLSLVRADIAWYGQHRRWAALARALRATLQGDNVQRCQTCGRRHAMWVAPDELYLEVHGNANGILCPECFTAEARRAGHQLLWVPRIWPPENRMDWLNDLCREIGAFRPDKAPEEQTGGDGWLLANALTPIVERIMTQHWDLAACTCWVCVEGRAAGCRPRAIWRDDRPVLAVVPGRVTDLGDTGRHRSGARDE